MRPCPRLPNLETEQQQRIGGEGRGGYNGLLVKPSLAKAAALRKDALLLFDCLTCRLKRVNKNKKRSFLTN